MQLLREQIFELQNAVIDKLSMFKGDRVIKSKSEDDVVLNRHVEEWLPETDRNKKLLHSCWTISKRYWSKNFYCKILLAYYE